MSPRPLQELSSPRHPLLKKLRAALRAGELTADGCCGVEGGKVVEEAMGVTEVMGVFGARYAVTELRQLAGLRDGRVPAYLVPDRVFRALAQTESSQGIAALVRLPEHSLEDCLSRPRALVAVLVGLQDPGNLGAILRALEAFGAAACLLAPNTVSPFNAKAVRASAGSLFRVPVFRRLPVEKILDLCRRHGLRTLGLVPRGGEPLEETDLRRAVALFVGQEGAGLPAALVAKLDAAVTIRLAAPVESLNSAMAASLALYEARRQRGRPRA